MRITLPGVPDIVVSAADLRRIAALVEPGESVGHRVRSALVAALAELVGRGERRRTTDQLIARGEIEVGRPPKNPPLLLYGNPPIRGVSRRLTGRRCYRFGPEISADVRDIRYIHAHQAGQPYKHVFDGYAQMWGIETIGPGDTAGSRDILLSDARGKPLWDMFPDDEES